MFRDSEGHRKSVLDKDIELVEGFLDLVLADINRYQKKKTYEKRMKSMKYHELVKKADAFAKQLNGLRDNKESYLSSF